MFLHDTNTISFISMLYNTLTLPLWQVIFWQSSIFSDFPIIRKIPNYVFYIVPKTVHLSHVFWITIMLAWGVIQIHCDKGSAISWAKIVASLRRSPERAFGEWREWTVQLYLFVVPCAQMPVIFMEFSKKKWYTECMLPKRGIFTAIIHRNDKGACLSDRA